MDDRVRRGLVALSPYALAVVIAFGMAAAIVIAAAGAIVAGVVLARRER